MASKDSQPGFLEPFATSIRVVDTEIETLPFRVDRFKFLLASFRARLWKFLLTPLIGAVLVGGWVWYVTHGADYGLRFAAEVFPLYLALVILATVLRIYLPKFRRYFEVERQLRFTNKSLDAKTAADWTSSTPWEEFETAYYVNGITLVKLPTAQMIAIPDSAFRSLDERNSLHILLREKKLLR